MAIINRPTPDPDSEDAMVFPAGSTAFIPVALQLNDLGTPIVLDADWTTVSPLVATTDPDASPVAWNTNALDADGFADDGTADTYDETHADYVGDQFDPEIPGLFAPVQSGGIPLRLALKIKVPSGAEQTSSNSARSYLVSWNLRKHGNTIPVSEDFNVGPSAGALFSDVIVTWDDVDITGASSITNTTQQTRFIQQAANKVYGWIDGCGIDPDNLPAGADTRAIKDAIIEVTRDAVSGIDLGLFQALQSIKEGPESKKWAIGVQMSGYERARESIKGKGGWCARYRTFRNVKSAIARQRPLDGLHGYDDP